MPGLRVITFNCAGGNPAYRPDPGTLSSLPFYRDVLRGAPDAPVLSLQEVTREHMAALRDHAEGGPFTLLHRSRPGQGNALLIPARYTVLDRATGYYTGPQLRAFAAAAWQAIRRPGTALNVRQYLEARMWLRARVRDLESGRELTVLATHLSPELPLRIAQARALGALVHDAAATGPVLLAADLNARTTKANAEVFEALAPLRDVARAARTDRPMIDWILGSGLEPVAGRALNDADAGKVSDHYALEARVRFP